MPEDKEIQLFQKLLKLAGEFQRGGYFEIFSILIFVYGTCVMGDKKGLLMLHNATMEFMTDFIEEYQKKEWVN